ncbi:uncharacterized protein LOC133814593 [Humulus lupulus]|uniref:uncharacterized protein LOC133814593 n=1 Tax=Humulus lupulus TaxID=3486 RepID=UPI002B408EE5|nr:uncharacterized protein LOC133814593 [Humulus lupulus]
MKKRREQNKISSYIIDEGTIIDDYKQVVNHFVDHFIGFMEIPSSATSFIYTDCISFGKVLDLDKHITLIKPFTKKDVKQVIFGIHVIKSPSPNGYWSVFFRAVWAEIGDEIAAAVLDFFDTGSIPESLNRTVISLVPEFENPTSAVDFLSHLLLRHYLQMHLQEAVFQIIKGGPLPST